MRRGKMWTDKELNFIKENHKSMTYPEICTALGISKGVLSNQLQKMISIGKLERKNTVCDNAWDYRLEADGRKKTQQLKKIKDKLDPLEKIEIRIFLGKKLGYEQVSGKVVQRTDNFITVDTGIFKESFSYTDFYNKLAVLV